MKKQVAVILGGPSAEHEVSIATGREVLKHINKNKYTCRIVLITRDKKFYYCDKDSTTLDQKDFFEPQTSSSFIGPVTPAASQMIWDRCDVALLALHGEFGEDGRFQGFLETLDIPYTGSGVFASAAGMDKIASKYLFEKMGIATPPYSIYRTDGTGASVEDIARMHGFPCFVKCPQSGSSRLMGRAESIGQLRQMLDEFSPETTQILVESNIAGDEYSCPVLEYPDGRVEALLPILIKPVSSVYFDYTAKYTDGACREIVPAPCSPELTSRLQQAALSAHRAINCRSISRTDSIVRDNTIYVLEINTLPGLTSTSLVPKAFVAAGGSYAQLLDILIETALQGRRP